MGLYKPVLKFSIGLDNTDSHYSKGIGRKPYGRAAP
jgi:hypothetical protein